MSLCVAVVTRAKGTGRPNWVPKWALLTLGLHRPLRPEGPFHATRSHPADARTATRRDGHGQTDRLDHDYLVSFKGIGPYAAAHCRMLLHDFSRIPIDSVVVAHLRERHDTTPADFIAARAECGAYLGLGYRLLRLREKFAVPEMDVAPPSPAATAY